MLSFNAMFTCHLPGGRQLSVSGGEVPSEVSKEANQASQNQDQGLIPDMMNRKNRTQPDHNRDTWVHKRRLTRVYVPEITGLFVMPVRLEWC